MARITVEIELDNEHQAAAYLRWSVSQYEQLMADLWYSDKYRHVPDGLRGRQVRADHPQIAGLSRTIRQLRAELRNLEVSHG